MPYLPIGQSRFHRHDLHLAGAEVPLGVEPLHQHAHLLLGEGGTEVARARRPRRGRGVGLGLVGLSLLQDGGGDDAAVVRAAGVLVLYPAGGVRLGETLLPAASGTPRVCVGQKKQILQK